jgi:DNA-binding NarL/FixJ family response regulator
LLASNDDADTHFAHSLDELRASRSRLEYMRRHLVYGEWLRRQRRRREARAHLRTAYDAFTSMGADAFAERARTELDATGAYVGRRESNDAATLTPQESRIAELVAEGTSSPEIAARLFVSRRTVESHLTKIYAKLGITSRTQLAYKILHNQDVPR